jgi:PAS domain S-box-containing protein
MRETCRVELHCHSLWSDGVLAPEELAAKLAAAGIQYAALTDHDSLKGQAAFRTACTRLGIGGISGIELTTNLENQDFHILGYGISLEHEELSTALDQFQPLPGALPSSSGPPPKLSAAQAISLIHKAGGIAFLAHPSITEPDFAKLVLIIEKLRQAGLDGIETFRLEERTANNAQLEDLAARLGLLRSAGTDYHCTAIDLAAVPGIDMPRPVWKEFRNAVLTASSRYQGPGGREESIRDPERSPARIHGKFFARHIVLPAIIALSLFAGVLMFAVIPAFERALLDRKREMIRELTNTAWSVLAEAAQEEEQGVENARQQAIRRIEAMRYGQEGKDYFWLQDTTPRMIMHPYRKDLNGSDLSGFTDPSGARIFMLFAKLVRDQEEGYVHYVWQWKDDPARLEPKESYIRLFKPWGWIIGTGLYTNDVKIELSRLQWRLGLLSAGIFAIVVFLLMYIMRSSLRIERKRTEAEEQLRETSNRYRTLVNAATEGMLFINDGRCKYGNPMALEMLGYAQAELDLIDFGDVLPDVPENREVLVRIAQVQDRFPESPQSGLMSRKDGTWLECAFTLQPAGTASGEGFLLLIRRRGSLDYGLPAPSRKILGKLLRLPASLVKDLRSEIEKAATTEAITALCRDAPKLVQSLLDTGASAPEIARMLSSITDAATCRLIRLGIDRLGEPPVPFAFLALGSQGRMEQTLFTDQDNAIIFALSPVADRPVIDAYFKSLADLVCTGLNNSGYRNCKGKVMANNPQWCQPFSVWKEYFSDWIQTADVHELMEFSIFFDFRLVFGQESLAQELRTHVLYRVQHAPRFFPQVAQNALQFTGKMESGSRFDLKVTSMPLTSFARLYALQHGIMETNTSARLEDLVRKGILLPSVQEEILTALALLLRLRLRHQASLMLSGGQPDNLVDPSTLGHIEKAILHACLIEIDLLQARIRRDFLGGE